MPNRDSATFEQVGPTATKASVEAMRRTTEMPSSALQRSSRKSTVSLALVPSPSVTPPALLISSAAAFIAASLLMPKTRTTPDFAPKPVIFTVRSCAATPETESAVPASSAAIATVRLLMVSSLKDQAIFAFLLTVSLARSTALAIKLGGDLGSRKMPHCSIRLAMIHTTTVSECRPTNNLRNLHAIL